MNVGSVFTEALPRTTLTALCFEIAYLLLRIIAEREFQILTLMYFHEPMEIECNCQQPSSPDLPLKHQQIRMCQISKPAFTLFEFINSITLCSIKLECTT